MELVNIKPVASIFFGQFWPAGSSGCEEILTFFQFSDGNFCPGAHSKMKKGDLHSMSTFQADPTDNSQNNPSTDEEIMRLFMQHQPMLFVFLHSILNDWEDAEEALQETSIVLWRKREQFAPGTSFVNWAMTIAQYQAHRFLRGRKQTPRLFNEQLLEQMTSEMVAEHDVFEARHRALRQCLERLQERDRYLISVAYGVNASKKSVSERLGMIPSRFYKVLNRIRQQLQKCIEQRLAAEGRT